MSEKIEESLTVVNTVVVLDPMVSGLISGPAAPARVLTAVYPALIQGGGF
jgi:hypothetical protein